MDTELGSGLKLDRLRGYAGVFEFVKADDSYEESPGRSSMSYQHQRLTSTSLAVLVSYETKVLIGKGDKSEESDAVRIGARVKASFEVIYSNPAFEEKTDEDILVFARSSSTYHSWPYWREFLSQACSRMEIEPIGLGPITSTTATQFAEACEAQSDDESTAPSEES